MSDYRLGVLGWPVSHSLSPVMFQAALDAYQMHDWSYQLLAVPVHQLSESWQNFQASGFIGCNVTIPYKTAVMPWVKMDHAAQKIGAVNTVVWRSPQGVAYPQPQGYNTDAPGLAQDWATHEVNIQGNRTLILGAGGAARAALYVLTHAGCSVLVWCRNAERGQKMIAEMAAPSSSASVQATSVWEDVVDWQPSLIVHCTPVGMWPHVEDCVWPNQIPFPQHSIVYDMVYRPRTTMLLQRAQTYSCRAISGIGMLVQQGAAAFQIFTGRPAPIEVMQHAIEK